MKKFLKSLLRILLVGVVGAEIIGVCFINTLMFQPQRATYDAMTPGYVDIGTNGVRLAAIVLGPRRGKKAVLRCHGNAEDAANTLWALGELAKQGYTVASVDYPGYGLSEGSPDEKGCYRAVHRLYDWLVETRGFSPEDIIVDGFSIGTGAAVELAATRSVGKLVLEASYLSAPRIVTKVRLLPVDPFPSLKRIQDVRCPIVFLHGTDDRIVPFSHGRRLHDLAPQPKRFIEVEGADHNDLVAVYGLDAYLDLFLRDFVRAKNLGVHD